MTARRKFTGFKPEASIQSSCVVGSVCDGGGRISVEIFNLSCLFLRNTLSPVYLGWVRLYMYIINGRDVRMTEVWASGCSVYTRREAFLCAESRAAQKTRRKIFENGNTDRRRWFAGNYICIINLPRSFSRVLFLIMMNHRRARLCVSRAEY